MRAQLGKECLEFGFAPGGVSGDLGVEYGDQGGIAIGLLTCLEAGDVLLDLFDQPQPFAHRAEAGVGRRTRLAKSGGAVGDEPGIERIVLGEQPLEAGEPAHLDGLEQRHGKALAAEIVDDCALVATACLDTDQMYAVVAQESAQRFVAGGIVAGLKYVAGRG